MCCSGARKIYSSKGRILVGRPSEEVMCVSYCLGVVFVGAGEICRCTLQGVVVSEELWLAQALLRDGFLLGWPAALKPLAKASGTLR
jgi:hypothetical protein